MGKLWELIQKHIDDSPYPPSERQVALRLGVAPTTLKNWRSPKDLPSRENLQAIADLTGRDYSSVLEAALEDTAYLPSGQGIAARSGVRSEGRAARRAQDEAAESDHSE